MIIFLMSMNIEYAYDIYYQKYMLQRKKDKDKQNITKIDNAKSGNMLYKAIEILKQDKEALVKENQQREKFHEEEKRKLKQEIQGYKKRVAELTEANILNNIIQKDPNSSTSSFSSSKFDSEINAKIRRLDLEVDHCKKILGDRDKTIETQKAQIRDLEKKCRQLVEDKDKHMEVSLTEKISLEEKIELLETEVLSKKKIVDGLKRELERANRAEFEVTRKEREIVKRGRDMNKFEEEFQAYFNENEKKYQRKIENLQEENKFLRKQIKKIAKKLKTSCQCEGEAQQWKQQLYRVGRQLAKARVQLGRPQISKTVQKQMIKKSKQVSSNSHSNSDDNQSSMDSLNLSEQSITFENNRGERKRI